MIDCNIAITATMYSLCDTQIHDCYPYIPRSLLRSVDISKSRLTPLTRDDKNNNLPRPINYIAVILCDYILLTSSPLAIMATSHSSEITRGDSPDPSSHAANIYDASGAEGEWLDELDETDDDDGIFEPTTDESEDAEYFDPSEDVEADFHGTVLSSCTSYADKSPRVTKWRLFANL